MMAMAGTAAKFVKKTFSGSSQKMKTKFASISHCGVSSDEMPVKLFDNQNLEDKLVAVVITIRSGSTYDPAFMEAQPETVPGERVSTYVMAGEQVDDLHNYLAGLCQPPAGVWQSIVQDVQQVEADSVTLNWECCAGCSESGFSPSQVDAIRLMGLALKRGHTVMCSDFSLKALIHNWSEAVLGPNPFVQLGTCDQSFQLDFVPSELMSEEVPQQLQVVGELCREQGKAIVAALGATILYAVNPRREATDTYTLKVLTVVSSWGRESSAEPPTAMQSSVGSNELEKKGFAGHVTLTYASGGQLVTSMGHWVELTHIDTSVKSVLRVAQHHYGEARAEEFQRELATKSSDAERRECVQQISKQYVQHSVPSKMKCRTKF